MIKIDRRALLLGASALAISAVSAIAARLPLDIGSGKGGASVTGGKYVVTLGNRVMATTNSSNVTSM